MRTNSTAFYILLCLFQSIPTCYIFIEKDVYGGALLSLIMGALASFMPVVGQFFAAPGLESMTGVPAIFFLIPLMFLLFVCHITGGVTGLWSLLSKVSYRK
ncbi:hypothetical protein POW01_17955 [Enterobacter cloacae]|uniref:hypothetical protein n=1 Tax=Enterobacter cloacae TaxID=550 RepID=UPI002FF4BB6B